MKLYPLILIVLLLGTSCIPRQQRLAEADKNREIAAFLGYLDAETGAERKQALHTLQQEFPQNPLTARAVKINQLEVSRAEQQAKIKRLSTELKQCGEKNTQQEADNTALRKDIEQLKQLVIEMEMRSR